MEEVRVLSPTGMLGYGYNKISFQEGLKKYPHSMAVDAGSTDAGPHKLGGGIGITSREANKIDLVPLIVASKEKKIPLIIGSAGGTGDRERVEWTLDIVKEIAKEKDFKLKIAIIWADIDKKYLKEKLKKKEIKPLGPAPELTVENIDNSRVIVAQMGVEPFIKALDQNPDVIIGGRSYDPSMTASFCIKNGFDPGLAIHMGKILECGALCAVPGSGGDSMMGYLRKDHFIIEPLNPIRRCTESSVAAHTLYEKGHPFILYLPGGELHLDGCKFEQIDDRRVKVSGSRFVPGEKYYLKLEGAVLIGYRSFCLAGIRDPIFIRELNNALEFTRNRVEEYFNELTPNEYSLNFRVYGRDGVMGDLEPLKNSVSHEIGLVIEVVADTQEKANAVLAFARATLLHCHYEGRMTTAGNIAFPFAPSDVSAGAVYKFAVYHLIEVEDPQKLFPIKIIEI